MKRKITLLILTAILLTSIWTNPSFAASKKVKMPVKVKITFIDPDTKKPDPFYFIEKYTYNKYGDLTGLKITEYSNKGRLINTKSIKYNNTYKNGKLAEVSYQYAGDYTCKFANGRLVETIEDMSSNPGTSWTIKYGYDKKGYLKSFANIISWINSDVGTQGQDSQIETYKTTWKKGQPKKVVGKMVCRGSSNWEENMKMNYKDSLLVKKSTSSFGKTSTYTRKYKMKNGLVSVCEEKGSGYESIIRRTYTYGKKKSSKYAYLELINCDGMTYPLYNNIMNKESDYLYEARGY